MRRLLTLVGVATAFLGACGGNPVTPDRIVTGSGLVQTESRPVQGFSAVTVSGGGRAIVEQTGVESLQITAEDNILPLLQAEVQDGRLVLGVRPHTSFTATRGILYRITVRDLSEIEASGASRVEAMALTAPRLVLRFSGASTFSGAGSVDRLTVELSGASLVQAQGLSSRIALADLSGASAGILRVSDALSGSVSGNSLLEYLGNPVVTVSTSGGSSVRRVGS